MSFAIIWDDMRAEVDRRTSTVRWVPLAGTSSESYDRAPPKVERCHDCGSMKAAGTRYHGAYLREHDGLKCKHGKVYWTACKGRVPPPCCWGDYKAGPTGTTVRGDAEARLAAFEAKLAK